MNMTKASGLTPWEFAHELQEHHLSGSEQYVAADVCDVLALNLLGALPSAQRSVLEQYPVIVLPTRQPNALCIAVPSGGAVIAIDYGLMSFLSVLNKVLLCRLQVFGLEPSLDHSSAARLLKGAFLHFFNSEGVLPRWPVSPKRMLVASALTNVQAAFVVGHEMAHAILGHLEPQTTAAMVQDKKLGVSAYSFTDAHGMEFAADAKAAEMVTQHFARIYDPLFGANEAGYSQAGVDIFFSYLGLIGIGDTPTHPSFDIRQRKLREVMWSRLPSPSQQLAEAAASMVGSFGLVLPLGSEDT